MAASTESGLRHGGKPQGNHADSFHGLDVSGQACTKLVSPIGGAIRRRTPVRELPCARPAPCPVVLSSHKQVGQHEKNANQCDSSRKSCAWPWSMAKNCTTSISRRRLANARKPTYIKGKITRIEPSLEAAFVDYGAERHGFLPLKEISSEYFVKDGATAAASRTSKTSSTKARSIVVQVDKEERGNKGAALTTFVSLAGRFIVLETQQGSLRRRVAAHHRRRIAMRPRAAH